MDFAFWGAVALTLSGWYFTGTMGAQLRQFQLSQEVGTDDDQAFEYRRFLIYLLLAVVLSASGVTWLYVM